MDDCVSYLQRMTTCSVTCVDVYIQYCQPNQIYIVCDVRDTCGATQPYYMLSTIVYYVTLTRDGTLYKHGQIECVYVLHTYVNVNKNNYSSDWDYRRKKMFYVCMHHVIVYTTLYWLYYLLSWRCYAMSLNYRNPSSRCTDGQYNAPQRRQRTDRYCLTHNNTVSWVYKW
jgi:hypothetical protein